MEVSFSPTLWHILTADNSILDDYEVDTDVSIVYDNIMAHKSHLTVCAWLCPRRSENSDLDES